MNNFINSFKFSLVKNVNTSRNLLRLFVTSKNHSETKLENSDRKNLKVSHRIFKDESETVLDVYEEEKTSKYNYELPSIETPRNIVEELNLTRGKSGVFEIDDLVQVLKYENGIDIAVIKIPDKISYADYVCIVSSKSTRHMQAISQFVRRIYKAKKGENDSVPKLEGANSKDWQALDLGNIALHIFSQTAREKYDLESLWALGPRLDPEYNKKDPLVDMLEQNTFYLKDLKPAR